MLKSSREAAVIEQWSLSSIKPSCLCGLQGANPIRGFGTVSVIPANSMSSDDGRLGITLKGSFGKDFPVSARVIGDLVQI